MDNIDVQHCATFQQQIYLFNPSLMVFMKAAVSLCCSNLSLLYGNRLAGSPHRHSVKLGPEVSVDLLWDTGGTIRGENPHIIA